MNTEQFTLKVKITITDKNEIIVGNGLFNQYRLFIEEWDDKYRVSDEVKHISDTFKNKDDCIRWIVKKLSEEFTNIP